MLANVLSYQAPDKISHGFWYYDGFPIRALAKHLMKFCSYNRIACKFKKHIYGIFQSSKHIPCVPKIGYAPFLSQLDAFKLFPWFCYRYYLNIFRVYTQQSLQKLAPYLSKTGYGNIYTPVILQKFCNNPPLSEP